MAQLNNFLVSYELLRPILLLDVYIPTTNSFDINFERAKLFEPITYQDNQALGDITYLQEMLQAPISYSLPLYASETQKQNDIKPSQHNVVQFFRNKGLTEALARGIYGNLMLESGLRLTAKSKDGHNSYGIALWTGNRKLKLFSRYGMNPNLNQLLEFLWEELNTSEKKALDALRKTNTIEDATTIFCKKFERPADWAANMKNRIKHARHGLD